MLSLIFFVQISFLIKNYILIAAINLTTWGPLYTFLVWLEKVIVWSPPQIRIQILINFGHCQHFVNLYLMRMIFYSVENFRKLYLVSQIDWLWHLLSVSLLIVANFYLIFKERDFFKKHIFPFHWNKMP